MSPPRAGTEGADIGAGLSRFSGLLGLVLALALAVSACGDGGSPAEDAGGGLGEGDGTAEEADPVAATMAAALGHLVANDHTFGAGPPPFTDYLVQDHLDPAAGTAIEAGADRALTDSERVAIEAALEGFGPLGFITDRDQFITDDLVPTIEGAVILGVGEPELDLETGTGLVPVTLWCGGVCGTWLTYQVELEDGAWRVVGVEGPVAVS